MGRRSSPSIRFRRPSIARPPSGVHLDRAGIYAESVNVSHSVRLVGPNAGVNPITGSRMPEAVIVPPATSQAKTGILILVAANNVTIEGLTLDGHNASLAGGMDLTELLRSSGEHDHQYWL